MYRNQPPSSDNRQQQQQHGRINGQGSTSSSPKSNDFNARSNATGQVSYSQALSTGSIRTTNASDAAAARQLSQNNPQTNGSMKPAQTASSTSNAPRQNNTTRQHNSGTNSPTDYRNGSNPNHRQPDNSRVVASDPARPPMKTNADTAIEDALFHMDELHRREVQTYNENIRERNGLQRFLRESFELQQREYGDAFKEQNLKMQNIAHERDELQKRMKIMQEEVKKLQQELHQARSIAQPDPIVVSTSAFNPHTADGVSGQDLIQDMERLNDEIYQFAALLVEEYFQGARSADLSPILLKDARVDALQKQFGRQIVKFVLHARSRQEHSWLLHAVQACIIASCTSVLTSFLPFVKGSSTFEDVHHNIRKGEGQGMSGQWRSLACRHGLDMETERGIYNYMRNDVWGLCDILGWSAKDSVHRESLKSIASKTLHLHKTIYVEILSGDITIISPELGSEFDPDLMEVSEARGADVKLWRGKSVICTTDMGLVKSTVEKVLSNERYEFEEKKTVILKAKVFLEPSAGGQ